ncbi:MAG: hypothetical protein WA173_02065 [Pseudomonas sp.]|uniref:hypothetical protein n=1 Tax=Pseudomonas sp. TaxID=306 RepID=UPI003BB6EECD
MNYVNNWQRPIALAADALTCALDLPDGLYGLTLADAPAGAIRWEIVSAAVAGGVATLARAQEGTTAQAWPSGSVIYAGLTAGMLVAMLAAGGAQVVLGEDNPTSAPPSGGALYVTPYGSALVALGTAHPEQWAALIGGIALHNFEATAAGASGSPPREMRSARVVPAAAGAASLTLNLPAWPVVPRGFYIDVLGSAASPITLNVNLAPALPSGSVFGFAGGEDYDSGASITLTGAVITIVAAHPVRFSLRDIYASEGAAEATVELSRLPYASISYIGLSAA